MLGNLAKGINIFKVTDAVTAGTDAALVESSAIDCRSYDRMLVILRIGATAAENGVVNLYVEDADTEAGTYTKIAASEITHTNAATGETAKYYLVDTKLSKPYAKVAYKRTAANTAFIHCTAILYNGKLLPEPTPGEVKEMVVN